MAFEPDAFEPTAFYCAIPLIIRTIMKRILGISASIISRYNLAADNNHKKLSSVNTGKISSVSDNSPIIGSIRTFSSSKVVAPNEPQTVIVGKDIDNLEEYIEIKETLQYLEDTSKNTVAVQDIEGE